MTQKTDELINNVKRHLLKLLRGKSHKEITEIEVDIMFDLFLDVDLGMKTKKEKKCMMRQMGGKEKN